jgi:Na+/H+-translocating membrane pyrophosphatase
MPDRLLYRVLYLRQLEPTQALAATSETGSATVIHRRRSLGMKSTCARF